MTFPSDWLFLPLMNFHLFLTSFFSLQPLSVHMCFNDHILGRSVPLFKMFESLPNALIIKCFFSLLTQPELTDTRLHWPLSTVIYGASIFLKLKCDLPVRKNIAQ